MISPAKNTEFVGRVVETADKEMSVIENEHLSLEFSNTTGLLTTFFNKRTQTATAVSQTFWDYRSYNLPQSSGAYIFRPTGSASQVSATTLTTTISGPFVQQVHQVFRAGVISQDVFVFNGLSALDGGFAEVHSTVGPLAFDQEVVTRFQTGLQSGSVFYSDNNGFELQQRVNLPNGRPGDYDAGVQIAGNYYPAVSRAAIVDSQVDQQFTVATQTTHGVASLTNGQLEVMLHRKCSRDDSRGMSEALDDASRYTAIYRFTVDTTGESTRFHQSSSKQLSFPSSISFGDPVSGSQWRATRVQFLANSLPENVFLLSLNARDGSADEVTLRLFNSFEAGSHPTLGQAVSVNLLSLFGSLTVTNVEERTLTLLHSLPVQPSDLTNIVLNPVQIRTFVVRLQN